MNALPCYVCPVGGDHLRATAWCGIHQVDLRLDRNTGFASGGRYAAPSRGAMGLIA